MLGPLSIMTTSRVPRDLESVTDRNVGAEVRPREVGLKVETVRRVWRAVERLYGSGIHPAIALCVRRNGHVVIDRAIGHASGNGPHDAPDAPKRPATTGTPFNIFSASKAVTAMVAHLLEQKGDIHVGDPVAEYIPEYARHGKHRITIRHVLSHRAGVPSLPPEALDLDKLNDRAFIVDVMCRARPEWRPGRMLGYHAISGGFIVGEIVRRVTGKPIDEVLSEHILDPLGFRWTNYGVAPADVGEVAVNYVTGPPVLPPLSNVLERALGRPIDDVVRLTNDPRFLTGVVPAGNVVTTANELSRFYQLLLDEGELDGTRIFEPRTIRRATAEESYFELDFTLMAPMRYAAGFMLGANWVSLYGPGTPNAFGHLGFTNIIGWADPDRGVAGALMTSGKPVLYPQLYYLWDILRTIASEFPRVRRTRTPPGKRDRSRSRRRPGRRSGKALRPA